MAPQVTEGSGPSSESSDPGVSAPGSELSDSIGDEHGNPVLEFRNIAKTFLGQVALDGIDVTLRAGQIVGLAGHNGSGKSTFIKILAGFHRPDPGAHGLLDGLEFEFGSSGTAFSRGLRFVHQDLDLIDDLSIFDNFNMSRSYRRPWCIPLRSERLRVEHFLADIGITLDARTTVGSLKASEKVGLAIAKAVEGYQTGAIKVLVLDEVDAFLPSEEKTRLFSLIRQIAARGVAVLYVSHNLSDVLELANRIMVLRGGVQVWEGPAKDLSHEGLANLVIGDNRESGATVSSGPLDSSPQTVIEADGLRGWLIEDLHITIAKGEIVGFTGLDGSGWEEIGPLFGGALRALAGSLILRGRQETKWNPRRAATAGVAYIPGDRRRRGVIAAMSALENIQLPQSARGNGLRLLRRRTEHRDSLTWMRRVMVLPRDPDCAVETLSGGNQQKVLLARALRLEPDLLVLDDPFQGVDVGAVRTISENLRASSSRGMALIVASSDAEELVNLCNRVVVLRDGRVEADLRGRNLTLENVVVKSGARSVA